ncbi:MAG: PaaI family thioesterase [Alphaproteobacteria bacterium]
MAKSLPEETGLDHAAMEATLAISPYQNWLGLKLDKCMAGEISITCPWREDLVSNPNLGSVHGGVLAALIDLGGLYSILTQSTRVRSTVDLRVDYHAPATPDGGTMTSTSTVLTIGGKISTAETRISDANGTLIASGRGVYMMAKA